MKSLQRLSGLVLGSALSCSTAPPPPEAPKLEFSERVPDGADLSYCKFEGRKDRARVVTNGPGSEAPNVARVFEFDPDSKVEARRLRCRIVDTNLDGVSDVIRTYTRDGHPLDEQADTNFDQRIDTWVRFARGVVIRELHDRDADGKPDENRVYSAGKLSRVQRDRNSDGRLDTWEVYDGEKLHRVGVDLDGDQRVDRWYRDELLKGREAAADKAAVDKPAVDKPAVDKPAADKAIPGAAGAATGAPTADATSTPPGARPATTAQAAPQP
jgi:hypothetical protein